MILAGDIGGTNTRLALCERGETSFRIITEKRFPSRSFASLNEIIEQFLTADLPQVERACFGVAGPVQNGFVKAPNLPWTIDAAEIKKFLEREQVALINDLEANAYGINELAENDFVVLNPGEPSPTGNRAIISAGTGLGEAGLHYEEKERRLRPFATEGGHADFAARTPLEIELLRYLLVKHDHVSCERVISGMGLINIYKFLRDTRRETEPAWLTAEIAAADDQAAVISTNALRCKAMICERALEIFVGLFAAEAGNFALKMLATNGVYLGGGIAPKILPKLQEAGFMRSFAAKGRMRELLDKIPVLVVTNDKAALLGACHFAFYEMNG